MKQSILTFFLIIFSKILFAQEIIAFTPGYLGGMASRPTVSGPLAYTYSNSTIDLVPSILHIRNEEITSIISDFSQSDIKVYPNPFSKTVFFSEELEGKVTIYNQLGQLVFEVEKTKNTKSLDLTSLPTGVYVALFRDQQNKTIQSIKLIKQN